MKKTELSEALRRQLLAGSVVVGTAVLALPSLAQDTDADEEELVLEQVVVTGTRIKRTEISESTPIFSFNQDELAVRGATNVADLLVQSPLFGGNQTPAGGQTSFTAGQNNVNIFDLGTQRTLTLVNGRRLVSGTSAALGGSEVDLNTIPASLVKEIQVVPLTGAATYGADAIAGTVNVILKDDYEGFEMNMQYGTNENENATTYQFSTLAGGNFDGGRGNIVFGFEYTDNEGLLQCDQAFLCEGNYSGTSTLSRYVDLDGDGQIDDINGDGAITTADRQSTHFAVRDPRLQLFTDYGAISQVGGAFLPTVADAFAGIGFGPFYGHLPDGKFYRFAEDGSVENCIAGGSTARSLVSEYVGPNTCSTDFFDLVSQIQSPTSRANFYYALNYDLTENIRLKQDVLYANTEGSELVNQGGFQTGFFDGTSAAIEVGLDNPLLSSQARQALEGAGITDRFLIHRFNNDLVDLGANSNETQTWRITNVLEGEFEFSNRTWFWDASVVIGKSDVEVRSTGIVDGRFLNAVDVGIIDDAMLTQIALQDPDDPTDDILLDDGSGNLNLDGALSVLQGSRTGFTETFQRGDIICNAYAANAAGTLTGFNAQASGSGLEDEDLPFIDGCVPLSLFGQTASPEALDFITGGPQISSSENRQVIYNVNLGSSLFDMPAGPVDFVLGYEKRMEDTDYSPSVGERTPITRSTIARPLNGGFETAEYYGEINVPLVDESMGIPLVQGLEFGAAYRDQEFSTNAPAGYADRSTNEDVMTANLRWNIIDDVALRATYATAFRNPSITELFLPASQTFIAGADPCDARSVSQGPNPSVRQANCESIGIDTTTFVSDIQDGTISGGILTGFPGLNAETSEAYTVGLILTPSFVDDLQITIDYYDLEIEDQISFISFAEFAAACYDSPSFPNLSQCDTFQRDADGQVVVASEAPDNVANSTFEAIALNIFYSFDLADAMSLIGQDTSAYMGTFNIRSQTQNNLTNEFQATADSEVTEDVGDFADPDWIGTIDIDYMYNDWRVNARARWQSSVLIDSLEQTFYAAIDEVTSFEATLDDGTPIEVFGGPLTNKTDARWLWDLSVGYSLSESTTIQANVYNLFDRRPNEAGNVAFGFGHFGLDERLGRRFSVRVNHKF